jgi:hypothetical protein
LRSRLLPLPLQNHDSQYAIREPSIEVKEFLSLSSTEREKFVTKIVDRSKSDKDEEKQAARLTAITLLSGLEVSAYSVWQKQKEYDMKKNGGDQLPAFLSDVHAFIPILHERSAPLKLIFEHVLMNLPTELEPN